jgi:predicted transcriptional regulator
MRGKAQGAHITFATAGLLWRTLTVKRMELLQAMAGQGVLSIRELARRTGRDVKSVHGDVAALALAGVIDRTKQGVEFPYDAVHVDFTLHKQAA